MRGMARFDCRKRNMREKREGVIQGGGGGGEGTEEEEEGEEEGAHLCWANLDNDLSDWREASVAKRRTKKLLVCQKQRGGTQLREK